MYLRTTRRRNLDGSIVEYSQLAKTHWDREKRRPTAHIIHNFGRADALDRGALLRLARSLAQVGHNRLDVPEDEIRRGKTLPPLRRRGYRKEGRDSQSQVVVGLALTRDGLPRAPSAVHGGAGKGAHAGTRSVTAEGDVKGSSVGSTP